jgi:formate dehydrogenase maturation protein FdhE
VVEATVTAGPPTLAREAQRRLRAGHLDLLVDRWLRVDDQPPIDRYLARAAASPVLEGVGAPTGAAAVEGRTDERRCPDCGGLPQLGYTEPPSEPLLGSRRLLLCSRCQASWSYPRMVCPGCGETNTARLPIYQDEEWMPHLRVEGCDSCRRFLVAVDGEKERAAVPLVDELAAMPLALYAERQGLTKIVPNLMEM